MGLENLQYIDAHTHLNFTHFDHDQKKVIDEMKDEGIGAINIGIDTESSKESITLAENHEYIWASIGCHPSEVAEFSGISEYKEMISNSDHVVAVGECGLDYSQSEYRSDKYKQMQKNIFVKQIELAAETDFPLILHIRPQEGRMDAYEEGLDILRHYQKRAETKLSGTAHFFVGSREIAEQFLDLGFYISFTGPLTYDQRLQDICAYLPIERVLAETDSPFAAPEPHRGKRNSPLYLPSIAKQIAVCRSASEDEVQSQLVENTANLFGLSGS
jgi:TatD DNase family protein